MSTMSRAEMSTMSRAEAHRIARKSIADQFQLERVVVAGKARMVPKARKPDGSAVNPEDQEAADAYNWFADAVEQNWR